MLRLAVDIQIAGSGTKQQNGGFWKYQLISHDMKSVINKTSVYLKTDEDYRTLVRTVKDNGKEAPVAVLTQVCSFSLCYAVNGVQLISEIGDSSIPGLTQRNWRHQAI